MADETRTFPEPPDHPAAHTTRIGHYLIRRVIASGGMGTVYEAVQEQPRRTVAVKLMKRGVVSASALRRFEFESQLLARLKHPGIAEVYEAGTHDDGGGPVPYFAMEYVPNAAPITAFAKSRGLTIDQRVELFVQVCDAVHHGHQKGIIHRDLKPDNIIVGPEGRCKVIDFGVARATDSDLAYATLQTEYGQLVGTLQYMSPEQVSADPHDIDIRSDVYALGVVLYELLSGRPPYDLRETPPLEAARRIRDEAPRNLSTTGRLLGGDLATITHKALEKDRERRYQSAGELAADLRRFLKREPITARPPTVMYQIKVFARRNRVLVGSVAAIVVALLAGAVTSTTLYVRAERQRAEAERQARRSLAAIGFVTDLVNSANAANVGQEVKVAELLDRYGRKVGEAFPDDPEIEAAVRTALGESYLILNDFEKAGSSGEYQAAARNHLAKALALRREALGERHPETLGSVARYAGFLEHQHDYLEAERLRRGLLAAWLKLKGAQAPETMEAEMDVARVLFAQGRLAEAERLARQCRDRFARVLGSDDNRTILCQLDLAHFARANGALAESEQLCRSVIQQRDPTSPPPRAERDDATRLLASCLLAQGKVKESAALYGNLRVPDRMEVSKWFQGSANPADGRPTLVAFLAEWCPFTHRAMPALISLRRDYGSRGLQVVGVGRDFHSDQAVRKFIEDWKVDFPMGEATKDFRRFYKFDGYPQYALVVSGRVVWLGTSDDIRELGHEVLDGILAAQGASRSETASAG